LGNQGTSWYHHWWGCCCTKRLSRRLVISNCFRSWVPKLPGTPCPSNQALHVPHTLGWTGSQEPRI
jgi:hypothetical protein